MTHTRDLGCLPLLGLAAVVVTVAEALIAAARLPFWPWGACALPISAVLGFVAVVMRAEMLSRRRGGDAGNDHRDQS